MIVTDDDNERERVLMIMDEVNQKRKEDANSASNLDKPEAQLFTRSKLYS